MDAVINVALPFFALVFGGYGAARFKVMEAPMTRGLNGFVFYFSLPAMLFVALAKAPVSQSFDWRYLAGYYGATLVVYAVAAISGRVLFGSPVGVMGLQGMAATFGNVGYMGLPICFAVFGEAGMLPAILILVVDNLLLNGLTIAALEMGKGGRGHLGPTVRKVLLGMAKHPLLLAIYGGLAVAPLGVALPVPLEAFLKLLGGAAAPCALFALGATIAHQPIGKDLGDVALLAALKLYFHPLAVWIGLTQVFRIDETWAVVGVVQAAMPIAASVFVMATQYQVYAARVSTAVLVSTAIAVVSVSLAIAHYAPAP